MSDRLGWVITFLCVIGIALSAVSVYNHYKPTPTEYCDFGDTFNCDAVNKSAYSHFGKIPVAGIGVIGYVFLFLLSRVNRKNKSASALLIASALVATIFSAWLTYVEARILMSYCIICLGSAACITLITILAIVRHMQTGRTATA
ncbi:MAG TPA: vitamin K epoxide reductase family protein [Terriglobales bacterium]|nr:vitamin K epoxide reductase family protein [Terriglobales bacterium]